MENSAELPIQIKVIEFESLVNTFISNKIGENVDLIFDYLFGVDTPEILFRHPALKT